MSENISGASHTKWLEYVTSGDFLWISNRWNYKDLADELRAAFTADIDTDFMRMATGSNLKLNICQDPK